MAVSYPTKIALASQSAGECAMPSCRTPLFLSGTGATRILGEAAHIAGEKPGSPRYDPDMTPEARNAIDNLIYLCPNCHKRIDRSVEEYPAARLHDLKAQRAQAVEDAMRAALLTVGFPELDEVTQAFHDSPHTSPVSDFVLLPPEEKLKLNSLGNRSRVLITMGLAAAREVGSFLESRSRTDPEFAHLLKNRFLEEYFRLYVEGHRGDDLFSLMCHFANRGHLVPLRQMVGLAVLSYLFESCEVFEK